MDRRLHESVTRGDVLALGKLIEQDEKIIKQRVPGSLNTVLHLAARFGHIDLAQVIVETWPDMVSLENSELETPLHVACREGHLEIVSLLLETDPSVAYKVNCRQESVLFAACERGNIHVFKDLLNFPRLLMLESDMTTSSLHAAASSGNTEIVKEILKARPDFARKRDVDGCTPLHVACIKGQLEITRELVKLDSNLCLIPDGEGRIPLHHAAIKGRINIIGEVLSASLDSAQATTFNGETILHVAVKNNQYEVVKYLTESPNTTKLRNMQDNDGNTILHLATAAKLNAMVMYILKIGIDINCLNRKGNTALDVVEADTSNSCALPMVRALIAAGAKKSDQLSPGSVDIQEVPESTSKVLSECVQRKSMSRSSRTPEHRSPSHRHHRQNRHRAKKLKLQNEGLRNARKTVTIVAVLVATVTFAAGINPPGGFSQDTGKAIRGNHAAFKVFQVCNVAALFLSIGVVNVHVSIIPFTRKTLMKLLTATHKVMWLSTLFMTAAYIAAIWTIMPDEKGTRWVTLELVVFGGGCTVFVFFGLGLMLTRHWYNKYKWRKVRQKKIKDESPHSSVSCVEELKMRINQETSSNSDVESSDHGYHLY
ncbi:Ankyrin repeat-containing protein NPR4 [Sesamum alatum]|uniref:Ankyrin repeat-containing protein NPR4 n=1 Tax=Sesamum alatum TaxID=300844 RepID=A0AAE1XXW6_9LAMI|nr:Ankyrin repeat-containing protein NPR4 [Sesamum alatum]